MEKEPIPFQLLDDSVTTYGFRVLTSGVDTSQFERNPVMLYDHDDWKMPIGKWANTRKEANRILADTAFDYDDADPEAQRIIGKVERGVIQMASVGITDLEVSDDSIYKVDGQEGPTIIRCRLREASITPFGANHNAMRLYDRDGKEIDLKGKTTVILSDLVKPNIKEDNHMNKELIDLLNLGDKATDEQAVAAVKAILAEKKKAEEERDGYKTKLDAIELAEKEARKKEAIDLVAAALKDGRLTEKTDGSNAVRDSWMKMFDLDHDMAKGQLEGLPPRQAVFQNLNTGEDNGTGGQKEPSAWEKRQAELEAKNK